jgi:hypothetical protein
VPLAGGRLEILANVVVGWLLPASRGGPGVGVRKDVDVVMLLMM